MPELGIVLNSAEEGRLIWRALREGAWLVPDLHYPTSAHDRLQLMSSIKLPYKKHVYSSSCTNVRKGTVGDEIRLAGRHPHYCVFQRNGGPTINFLSTVEFVESAETIVNPGFIAHYPAFWNPVLQDVKMHENRFPWILDRQRDRERTF